MTKIELVELVRRDMLESIRQRDAVNPDLCLEARGYHNGHYHAYKKVLELLTMFDIEEVDPGDSRSYSVD